MDSSYIDLLKKRGKESKVYSPHQMTGLLIAEILGDEKHKALYIKLAKTGNPNTLLGLAKDVADRENIKNKGAYFMKVLYKDGKSKKVQGKKIIKKSHSKQGEIF